MATVSHVERKVVDSLIDLDVALKDTNTMKIFWDCINKMTFDHIKSCLAQDDEHVIVL